MKKLFTLGGMILLVSLFKNASSQIYYKDVAPALIANCTSCHHPGGIQFSLTTFSAVSPMVFAIKNSLQNGNMPPWPPDPNYKHYVHERVISATDKNLILDWINAGAPAGDTTLAPSAPSYGSAQLHGTPDEVITFPTYTSNAGANDMYVCLNKTISITQTRYIRAFEYIPGNAAIIHHAVITIDTTGTAVDDLSGNCNNFQGQINIGDYAPGMGPTVLPNAPNAKFGFRLKAGSKISIQLHVPKGTVGQQDQSKLNLFYYANGETGIRDMFFETALQNWNFMVPPNSTITTVARYPVSGNIPIDISLYSAFPHSHQTCTSIINFAYKATDTIPLIKIPKWDFHWQGQYVFPNMVKFPAGYRLYSAHVFDNTVNNPNTPNPNVAVQPGLFTDDEMHFDSYLYSYYLPGDELIDIASIISNDPLLNPLSNQDIKQIMPWLKVFPNPFSENVHIQYLLNEAKYVQAKIFNINGALVSQLANQIQKSGVHQLTWNASNDAGKKLPSGIYFYQIQIGNQSQTGKIILE